MILTSLGVVEAWAGPNTNTARPNLVIIYADDMGFGDMGTYAAMFGTTNPAPTPHMDALATQGLIFTQAHSANAVCTPSRYSLLTGKYNWRTFSGISLGYAAPDIPAADTTLAEFLKTYNYETAAFGKWHLGGSFYRRNGTPYTARDNSSAVGNVATNVDWEHPLVGHATDNGFDIFRGFAVALNVPPYVYVRDNRIQYYDSALGRYRDALNSDTYHYFTIAELNDGLTVGTDARVGLGDPTYKQINADPIMLDDVAGYMAGRATNSTPFFAYVAMHSPHMPWHITPAFTNQVGFAYGDWMAEVDNRIGRILTAIETNGLGSNTVVIFTSDNGPETTAFTNSRANGRDPNGPWRGVKRDIWEGGTRVPFIVRWPGQVASPGSVSGELIWQGDIFATFAAFLGAELPANVAPDGESFLPLLRGQPKPAQRRDSIVVASYDDHRSVICTNGWKLIDSTGGGGNATSYDSRNNDIASAIGVNQGMPKQLFFLPLDFGEDTNRIAGITDELTIRNTLTNLTGRDLLARLDQYRTNFTSEIFPRGSDTDGDGMPDAWEQANGLNASDPADAGQDPDGDGLTNLEEYQNSTNPHNSDTDADNLPDGFEVKVSLTSPTSPDTDGDGLSDGAEVTTWSTNPLSTDTDSDGVSDAAEVMAFSNPRNAASHPVRSQTTLSPSLVQLVGGNGTTNDPKVTSKTNWLTSGPLFVRARYNNQLDLRTQLFLKFDLTGISGVLTDARLRLYQESRLNTNTGSTYTSSLELARVTQSWGTNAGSFPLLDQTPVTNAFIFAGNEDFGASTNAQGFYSGTPGTPGINDLGFNPSGQITTIVSNWLTGATTNHGFRIRLLPANSGISFASTNNPGTAFDERLQLLVTTQSSSNNLDSDGDRLPDAWELAHTNSLAGLGGSGDADGDGASNALELAMGADPFNAQSRPALKAEWVSNDMQFHFSRSRLYGYGYELQVSTDLIHWGTWAGTLTQLASTPLNSDYEQANFSCQPSAGAPALFVRLEMF